jgi:methionyl-tRNA formyltransferase
MRIVFMGTPEFAVPSLNMLIEEHYEVVGVVTQPDRPKGRKRVPTPPPVKETALAHGIPVLQPAKIRDPLALAEIEAMRPDLIITAAYGQILPVPLLELPPYGCINVHGSLLPKYRGGAPIQRAIMNGDDVTGVTIMYMAEGMDTGDMISKATVPIGEEDTSGTLFEKLSRVGADLLRRTLPDLIAGKVKPEAQREEEATYAPNLTREDERIRWERSSRELFNQIRALHPWVGAFTYWNGEVLKIWRARPVEHRTNAASAAPGTIVGLSEEGIDIVCGDGSLLRLTEIQPAGKRAMPAAEWIRSGKVKTGTVLGV